MENESDNLDAPIKQYNLGAVSYNTSLYTLEQAEEVEKYVLEAIGSEKYDIVLAPEYAYYTEKRMYEDEFNQLVSKFVNHIGDKKMLVIPGSAMVVYQDEEKAKILDTLEKGSIEYESAYENSLYVQNVIPIIKSEGNGEVDITYYMKKTDFFDSRMACSSLELPYISGTEKGLFEWDNLKIGVEICLDHNESILKKDGGKNLDLHLIISKGMSIKDENTATGFSGYVVCCDGREKKTTVEKEDTKFLTRIKRKEKQKKIEHFVLEF